MEKSFIDKVHNIVINNITNENFGVGKLASLIGLSTSQTLKKVRAITGKSVNQYIREIRLTEAAYLIKETDLTIAEIAYKVGFGSQSYFNKVFRKYYGKTPGDYKFQDEETIAKNIDLTTKQKSSKPQKIIFFIIFIIALLIIGYMSIDKTNNQPPSIAVLPFKNISNELENQYLADGMWDDLLNHLSTINGLDVRSRQSLESYRGSDKSIIEIGKELSAAYILESSIQKFENKLRIITQLIDAESDKHLWSHEYDYELKDIIKIQCEIAKQITQQLNVILTSREKEILEMHSTENIAAYQLVLKGRSLAESHKIDGVESSIEMYEKALEFDPNYALAYAEMAQSYFILRNKGYDTERVINKSIGYLEQALKIDPNIYKAYAVRARIFYFRSKWEKCRENFEKAIAINPNDAEVQYQYSLYFQYKPIKELNKSLEHLTIAQRLNPLSKRIGNAYFNCLIINQKNKKANEYLNKMNFIYSEKEILIKENILIVSKNKDWSKSIIFFKNKIVKDPKNPILYNLLGRSYDEILNDDINFLKYLKIAYELDSTNFSNAYFYFDALVESKNFDKAKILFDSKNFKSLFNEKQKLSALWYLYYYQGNYMKSQEFMSDSLIKNVHISLIYTFAQLGDKMAVDSLLSKNPGYFFEKSFVYAILKEKDSMYHYMNRMNGFFLMKGLNSRGEFDPYRKEERYKAFLRENYLPITHWNE